jgi:hypothetical protein
LRRTLFALAAVGVGCGQSYTLTLTATPSTIDSLGQPSIVVASVATKSGKPGSGTVTLSAPAGAFVGAGLQDSLTLDATGLAAASFVCGPGADAGCPSAVQILAAWKDQTATAMITVTSVAADAGSDGGTPPTCATGGACRLTDGGPGTCCGACVDTSSDALNCSSCGLVCALGATCQSGVCYFADAGYAACLGPAGCPFGGCAQCPPGSDCVLGRSQLYCTSANCTGLTDGFTCALDSFTTGICCQGRCVDSRRDSLNCGTCQNDCGVGLFCSFGTCAVGPDCAAAGSTGTSCPLPDGGVGACCEATCADVRAGNAHCGACRVACPSGAACTSGHCATPDGGLASCSSPGACAAGSYCQQGGCLPSACPASAEAEPCAFGLIRFEFTARGFESFGAGTCCQQLCVDLGQDPSNCGACGRNCSTGNCETGFFAAPACWPPDGGADAGCSSGVSAPCNTPDGGTGICCDQCRDPLSDPLACGGCAITCPGGQTCLNGVCQGAVAPCGNGHVFAFCAGGRVCCPGGGCTDLAGDPGNCGACGYACDGGQSCDAGACS